MVFEIVHNNSPFKYSYKYLSCEDFDYCIECFEISQNSSDQEYKNIKMLLY